MEKPKHGEDEKKQGLLDGENGDGEHKRMHSEETESVVINSEAHSRSSSSSSSSSASYLSPSKDLPEDGKESLIELESSPTHSPSIQVMDRDNNEGYDPNRIPSSVFERSKSNIPAEWSCASNESLFSIHVGRNSFSVYGADLMKSGELFKSGELLEYSPALPMPPPPGSEPKPVKEPNVVDDSAKEEEAALVVESNSTSSEEEDEKRMNHVREQHPAVSWKTPTNSYRSSNRSSNSTHSFSFPILAGAASDSANVETMEHKKQPKHSQELQDSQQPADAASSKQQSSMCRWFSCFPSCPWCCSSCSCS